MPDSLPIIPREPQVRRLAHEVFMRSIGAIYKSHLSGSIAIDNLAEQIQKSMGPARFGSS